MGYPEYDKKMESIENRTTFNESESKHPTADMVPANAPEAAAAAAEKPVGAYRFLAVLFALLAVGGLFLGLLGRAWRAASPVGMFTSYGTTLSGSLVGYVVDYMKWLVGGGLKTAMQTGAAGGMSAIVNLLLVIALLVATVFSIVAMFIALFSKKRARRFSLASGVLLFLAYIGLFLWSYFYMSSTGLADGSASSMGAVCDIPTAIVAIVALFPLAIAAVASGRRCFVNVLLLLFPLLIAFLMCYPGSETVAVTGLNLLAFGSNAFLKVATLFFMVIVALDIVVSALRLFSKRAYAFDCFRFALLVLGAILMVIAFIAAPAGGSRWVLFKGKQLFYTIGILVLAIGALVAAIVLTVVLKRAEMIAKYAETFPGIVTDGDAPVETAAPASPVAAEQTADAPVAEVAAPVAPVAAEQAPAFRDDAPPYPFAPAEAPISEFERRMEALARGEQPDYIPAGKQPQTPAQPYSPLARGGSPYAQRNAGYADQYTYDPFINSLSPQEKNEFGDLFIACKAGKVDGLPIYAIGGDNKEFFRKVFIYLGKFRKDISNDLLDKLYQYVSRNS